MTSRLRKTFRYPEDNSDNDSGPEAMDEEEQENLISSLRTQNEAYNKAYSTILLSLALFSTTPYLYAFTSPPSNSHTLLSLLSITSLLSTAFLTYILPPEETGIKFLDKLNGLPSPQMVKRRGKMPIPVSRQGLGGLLMSIDEEGPIRRVLPLMNVGLCLVLMGLGRVVSNKGEDNWEGLSWLPAAVYGVVILGKWVMGSVDPERELGELRYEFKGA
ncbi:hypothetical protein BGZ60DRAFT_476232 [Tricladium varicosporioides]|nr:hypothetical protein BGZ60DRAFT_476232 [Hymenoscyphus varicosporioides]